MVALRSGSLGWRWLAGDQIGAGHRRPTARARVRLGRSWAVRRVVGRRYLCRRRRCSGRCRAGHLVVRGVGRGGDPFVGPALRRVVRTVLHRVVHRIVGRRLDVRSRVNGVETAFHDGALRAGDDFPDALHDEIDSCDLMIAVIGPEWLGERDGELRIRDPDDWVVREIATAFASGTRVLPILIGGADHPLASHLHPSIAELTRLHALPFEDDRDLATVVEHVESHLSEMDLDRARLAGLEEPVVVPKLERPWVIGAASASVAVVSGVALRLTSAHDVTGLSASFDDKLNGIRVTVPECASSDSMTTCVQDTAAFSWFGVIMVLLGLYAGAISVVGGVLAWRLARVSDVAWRPLLGAAGLGGLTLLLLTFTSRSGHFELADVPGLSNPDLRFWTHFVVTVTGALGVAFCVLAPVFSSPKAAPHLLGERVRYLGIARDAERWGATLLAGEFSLVAAAGGAILIAFRQSDLEGVAASPLPGIVFALVFSTILIILHFWSISRLRDEQRRIEMELAPLAPRYRGNAEPKLIARTFDDGGWGFRAFLALPLIVAVLVGIAVLTDR